MNTTEFLAEFLANNKIIVAKGSLDGEKNYKNWRLVDKKELQKIEIPANDHLFFTPAFRQELKINEKTEVLGSVFVWMDWDSEEYPNLPIKPYFKVKSGHGWHIYYKLDEPIRNRRELEELNKKLLVSLNAPNQSEWNCNRFMRVPGSLNVKDSEKPVKCELVEHTPVLYTKEEIQLAFSLTPKTMKRIATGDARGFKDDRSRLDMAVITELVVLGADTEDNSLIYKIFQHNKIGAKAAEQKDGGAHYLKHSIQKAIEFVEAGNYEKPKQDSEISAEITEIDNCYYIATKRGPKQVSTFIINPKIILDGEKEDAIIGDVISGGVTWENITFPKKAFNSLKNLQAVLTELEWSWKGDDASVRELLPYLVKKLDFLEGSKIKAVTTLGYHEYENKPYFVSYEQALNIEGVTSQTDGQIAWLASGKEYPKVRLETELDQIDLNRIFELVPNIQKDAVIWPMLGWYAASALKQWLDMRGTRFPILTVYGTMGSGKTSLTKALMSLFGNIDPNSYDSGTTRFMITIILNSANCFPVSFSESRTSNDNAIDFLYMLRVSYDQGYATRGRADQTTIRYPLVAPVTVDGEDLPEDSAFRERIVIAHPRKSTTEEGSEYFKAFKEFEQLVRHDLRINNDKQPLNFAGFYFQELLKLIETDRLVVVLKQAREAVQDAFPGKMPDRIRNNYTVLYFGLLLLNKIFDFAIPKANVFKDSIGEVVNFGTGKSLTQSDRFIESILHALGNNARSPFFKTEYDRSNNIVKLHVKGAYEWWVEKKVRRRERVLDVNSLKSQLDEATYSEGNTLGARGILMLGINLQKAKEYGLDIPDFYDSDWELK